MSLTWVWNWPSPGKGLPRTRIWMERRSLRKLGQHAWRKFQNARTKFQPQPTLQVTKFIFELLNHISKYLNKSYLFNASQILGRIPIDLTSLSNKLSVQLLSKFLSEGAILGSVTTRPKNKSFLMSISALIEYNSANLSRSAQGTKSGTKKSFLRNQDWQHSSSSSKLGVIVNNSAPNKREGRQACLHNLA